MPRPAVPLAATWKRETERIQMSAKPRKRSQRPKEMTYEERVDAMLSKVVTRKVLVLQGAVMFLTMAVMLAVFYWTASILTPLTSLKSPALDGVTPQSMAPLIGVSAAYVILSTVLGKVASNAYDDNVNALEGKALLDAYKRNRRMAEACAWGPEPSVLKGIGRSLLALVVGLAGTLAILAIVSHPAWGSLVGFVLMLALAVYGVRAKPLARKGDAMRQTVIVHRDEPDGLAMEDALRIDEADARDDRRIVIVDAVYHVAVWVGVLALMSWSISVALSIQSGYMAISPVEVLDAPVLCLVALMLARPFARFALRNGRVRGGGEIRAILLDALRSLPLYAVMLALAGIYGWGGFETQVAIAVAILALISLVIQMTGLIDFGLEACKPTPMGKVAKRCGNGRKAGKVGKNGGKVDTDKAEGGAADNGVPGNDTDTDEHGDTESETNDAADDDIDKKTAVSASKDSAAKEEVVKA